MNEKELSQDAKSFVNDIFTNEIKQKQHNKEKEHLAPIDLSAGGQHNFERFIHFPIPPEHQTSYLLRFRESALLAHNIIIEDVKSILHVLMNMEQITFKMTSDYYDDDQLNVVANQLAEITMMYESLIVSIIDNRDKMANAFHDISHAAGSKRIMNHFRTKHATLHAERITINYIVQDLAQTYIHCITDSLRTDMVSMSQFTYQIGLLAENVSEVLSVLNDKINQSD